MSIVRTFDPSKPRRFQVEYRYGGTWTRPTGPGFRTRLFAFVDALAWRSNGYASRVLDTACESASPAGES